MTIKCFHIKRIWEIVKNRLLKGFLTHCLLQFFFLLPFFLLLRKCAILMLHSTPAHGHSFTEWPVLSLNQNMDEKAAGWNWTWAIQKASHSQGNFSQHLCSGTHWAWPHLLCSPWLTASITFLWIKPGTSFSHLCCLSLSLNKVAILKELQPLENFSLSRQLGLQGPE